MTRTLKQRALFTLTVTVLMLALGLCAGYLFGGALVLYLTHNDLEQYAQRLEDRAASVVQASVHLLEQANASGYAYCSEAELYYFRSLIVQSQFIQDLGHMRNGQIDCSAILGHPRQPILTPPPERAMSIDGRLYEQYRHLPPMETATSENHGMQWGNAYALHSNYRYATLGPPSIHFVRNVFQHNQEEIHVFYGEDLKIDPRLLDKEGILWRSGGLYFTQCTTARQTCTTTFIAKQVALAQNAVLILICMVAGGLVGVCLGLYCALIFRRSQSMERQLRRALRDDRIQVVYQPIVHLMSGRMVGVEALARWTDEDGFAVSPLVFVALSEERGYVSELTQLVTRHAVQDLGKLLRGNPEFHVSINVTASDLAGDLLLPMLEGTLSEAGVAAQSLAIEITESSTAHSPGVRETIVALRQRGHSVQIDDFGTGYSSLSYLHELSVDALKIDQAFTRAIGTEAVTVGILPQILVIAKSLNLQVIVEGIETVEQAAYFAGAEVNLLAQGWLFGRPMPAEAILELHADAKAAAAKVD